MGLDSPHSLCPVPPRPGCAFSGLRKGPFNRSWHWTWGSLQRQVVCFVQCLLSVSVRAPKVLFSSPCYLLSNTWSPGPAAWSHTRPHSLELCCLLAYFCGVDFHPGSVCGNTFLPSLRPTPFWGQGFTPPPSPCAISPCTPLFFTTFRFSLLIVTTPLGVAKQNEAKWDKLPKKWCDFQKLSSRSHQCQHSESFWCAGILSHWLLQAI